MTSDRENPAVGSRIILHDVSGTLVADLDRWLFSEHYPAKDWAYLGEGYLVLDDTIGLVHLPPGEIRAVPVGSRPADAVGEGVADAVIAKLRERLAAYDGRSPAIPSKAAADHRNAPSFLAIIIKFLTDDNRMVSEAASWIIKAELEAGIVLDRKTTEELVASLGKLESWQAKLHICQTICHLDVPASARESMRRWLTPLLDGERPFLRAWALDALCKLPGTQVNALLRRMAAFVGSGATLTGKLWAERSS